MNKISQKAIQTIQNENLKPLPKGFFVILNISVLIATIIILALGALALSSFMHASDPTGFQLLLKSKPKINNLPFILNHLLPASWLIIITITTAVGLLLLKKSNLNYKIDFPKITLLFFIPQLLLGLLFLQIELPHKLDDNFSKLGIRDNMRTKTENRWFNPEKGTIVGQIKIQKSQYILIDPKKKEWQLQFVETSTKPGPNEHIRLQGEINPKTKFIQVLNWQKIPPKFQKP